MKNSDQRSSTKILEKYGGMALYDEDMEKRYTIGHEDIYFFKKKVWSLVGLPDELDGSYTYHELLFIHKGQFDRILSAHQNDGI